jgi:alpha-2-macroglobulin
MALTRANKGGVLPPLVGDALRWLMIARREGHWQTTQETAWSLLALTEYMQASGELTGNFTYQVLVNGKLQGADVKVDKFNLDRPQLQTVSIKDLVPQAANELLITRGAGEGKLYYSANLRYFLSADNLPALNKGIIVGRQYYAVNQQTLKPGDSAIASAKVGEYVQVRLVIVAPTELHYLALEDPLPAGFEAVDTTLKTSSVAAQAGQLKEQVPSQPGDQWFRPYWSYWSNTQVRDDKVALFATYLGRGTYEYSYLIRASVGGTFRTLPARAWEMYFPDVMGRSEGARFQVLP